MLLWARVHVRFVRALAVVVIACRMPLIMGLRILSRRRAVEFLLGFLRSKPFELSIEPERDEQNTEPEEQSKVRIGFALDES